MSPINGTEIIEDFPAGNEIVTTPTGVVVAVCPKVVCARTTAAPKKRGRSFFMASGKWRFA